MKFSYKVKDNHIDLNSRTPIADFLRLNGINKVESFIDEPAEEDYLDPRLLRNIEEAVKVIHESFKNNEQIYLQPDPDVDGICSGAIFYAYFKELYPESSIIYETQEEKMHGIVLEKIPIWVDTVVIVDAGSNDIEQQKELIRSNKKVIILDHHLIGTDERVDGVILVNNQDSPEFYNKSLSGAGVVYKFIDLYSQTYGDGKSHKKYMDLAALGIISDMMDSRNLDNNYIIYHGLKNIQNPMFRAILDRQSYSISSVTEPTKIDLAFYVAPLINGVVRVGTFEQNMDLFKAFSEYNITETFMVTSRREIKEETYYERMAREAYNTRGRQNRTKVKIADFLNDRIEEEGIQDNAILTLVSSNTDEVTLPKTMTGLVAMDFVQRYRKPTLMLRPRIVDGEQALFGSGRAIKVPGFSSFKDELNKSGLVIFAEGHDMAFGVGVKKEDLDSLNEYMNHHLKDIDFGSDVIEVDYAFEHEPINLRMLWDFAENSHLYGNMIPEPLFAFKFLLNSNSVDILGRQESTLKFTYNGLEFIKFHAKEDIEKLTTGEESYMAVAIGRAVVNEFAGNRNLQIVVTNLDVQNFDRMSLL